MTPPPRDDGPVPLDAAYRSVAVPARNVHWLRRLPAFLGPGYLVAIGYMDPGNWATGLAAGSGFGYAMLWVVMLANFMAILLQILSVRLGIATGMDLAQACRRHSSRRSSIVQWLLCEVAICATDMAEVIGTAIALKLLFGLPLAWGVAMTVLDVLLVLWLQQRGFRYLEAMVMAMLSIVFVCFMANVVIARPEWGHALAGFLPTSQIAHDPQMLYLAIGIIGATVMPHNLYLHSSAVQTRRYDLSEKGKREAMRYATVDIVTALLLALVVNAAIVVLAAAVFHRHGHQDVADIQDAYRLLTPLLGTGIAGLMFGLALLASGQSSTLTATLAGQIVMEGFLQLRMPAWGRRLLTRGLAVVPAMIAVLFYGDEGMARLLIFSQVVLSLQLPFAVIPLVKFTSDKATMGSFANSGVLRRLAWAVAGAIIVFNVLMLASLLFS